MECRGTEVLEELTAVLGTDWGGGFGGEILAGRGRSGSGEVVWLGSLAPG